MIQAVAALMVCLAPVASDGDTLRCGPSKGRVRVFGIESIDKSANDAKAKIQLQALVAGGLVCEVKGASYDRVVAMCYNATNVEIGKALLDTGLVHEWCSYSRNYYGTCKATHNRR